LLKKEVIETIKSVLKKILFRGFAAKTFLAVRIAEDKTEEKVFLLGKKYESEISKGHCVVCHRPFLIAVWITSDQLWQGIKWRIVIKRGERTNAAAQLLFHQKIQYQEGFLILFSVRRARSSQLDFIRQLIILRYFKNKDTYLEGKIYAALYTYPRQIIIVSFGDQGYYNIFPMDFYCLIEKSNQAIFGLRTTNFTIEKVLQSRKLAISDSSSLRLETIYQLGRNHSQSPPLLSDLPFGTIKSELFRFPIPENCAFYREIEIVDSRKIGSHMLLVGNVINTVQMKEKGSPVHHIHFFQSVITNYEPA
jgi:flavin reductase (DIM6/NTAB) family NADH-FMN oxidoreductase RutF